MKKLMVALLFLGACSSSNQLSEAPSWYIEPPEDKENIYAAGYASDSNLQFAMDVSVLSAKRTLASHISSTKITNVDLAGYKREEIEVEEDEGQYMVYVLLAYPISNISQEPPIFKGLGQ